MMLQRLTGFILLLCASTGYSMLRNMFKKKKDEDTINISTKDLYGDVPLRITLGMDSHTALKREANTLAQTDLRRLHKSIIHDVLDYLGKPGWLLPGTTVLIEIVHGGYVEGKIKKHLCDDVPKGQERTYERFISDIEVAVQCTGFWSKKVTSIPDGQVFELTKFHELFNGDILYYIKGQDGNIRITKKGSFYSMQVSRLRINEVVDVILCGRKYKGKRVNNYIVVPIDGNQDRRQNLPSSRLRCTNHPDVVTSEIQLLVHSCKAEISFSINWSKYNNRASCIELDIDSTNDDHKD
eukprot:gene993-345_t